MKNAAGIIFRRALAQTIRRQTRPSIITANKRNAILLSLSWLCRFRAADKACRSHQFGFCDFGSRTHAFGRPLLLPEIELEPGAFLAKRPLVLDMPIDCGHTSRVDPIVRNLRLDDVVAPGAPTRTARDAGRKRRAVAAAWAVQIDTFGSSIALFSQEASGLGFGGRCRNYGARKSRSVRWG